MNEKIIKGEKMYVSIKKLLYIIVGLIFVLCSSDMLAQTDRVSSMEVLSESSGLDPSISIISCDELEGNIFYKQFSGIIAGNREVMKTMVNLNKGCSELNINVSQLELKPIIPRPHISKELLFLLTNIKNTRDILKYKQLVILLSHNEKRILEEYLWEVRK